MYYLYFIQGKTTTGKGVFSLCHYQFNQAELLRKHTWCRTSQNNDPRADRHGQRGFVKDF